MMGSCIQLYSSIYLYIYLNIIVGIMKQNHTKNVTGNFIFVLLSDDQDQDEIKIGSLLLKSSGARI